MLDKQDRAIFTKWRKWSIVALLCGKILHYKFPITNRTRIVIIWKCNMIFYLSHLCIYPTSLLYISNIKLGNTINNIGKPTTNPPITAIAIGCCICAPKPKPRANKHPLILNTEMKSTIKETIHSRNKIISTVNTSKIARHRIVINSVKDCCCWEYAHRAKTVNAIRDITFFIVVFLKQSYSSILQKFRI